MTIKETAGKMLLYFYQLQRAVPSSMRYRQLVFIDRPSGGIAMSTDKKWLTKDLLDITPSTTDILNAFVFLCDKDFIESTERASVGRSIYIGIQLTSSGIDIIEGVEGGDEGQKLFSKTFNIEVDSPTVAELIDANLTLSDTQKSSK